MIDSHEAEQAFHLLKVSIAGLAEDVVELAVMADVAQAELRLEWLERAAGLGQDITALAEAAACLIRRAV